MTTFESRDNDSAGVVSPSLARRTIVQGAAWTVPAIAVASAAPLAAASGNKLIAAFTSAIYSAEPNDQFDTPVVGVLVRDDNGNPVANATVTITVQPFDASDEANDEGDSDPVPASDIDPTATWSGSPTFTVTSDANGLAIAPGLMAGAGWGVLPITAIASKVGMTTSPQAESALRITPDFTVWAWGSGSSGALGTGSSSNAKVPVAVQLPQSVTIGALAVSGFSGRREFAIQSDGSLWAWGSDSYDLVGGTGSKNVPVQFPSGYYTQVANGYYASYALTSAGNVVSWGNNAYGALGTGTVSGSSSEALRNVLISDVVEIAPGYKGGLARKSDGSVWTWGDGHEYQQGTGSTGEEPTPVQIALPGPAVSIAARKRGGLAVLADGTVWSWGDSDFGMTGQGTSSDIKVPTQIVGLTGATTAFAGYRTSGVILSNGSIRTWGRGADGALGNGDDVDSKVPVNPGLTGVKKVVGGYHFMIALMNDGTLRAWGKGDYGTLGNGGKKDSFVPVTVLGLSNVVDIGASYLSAYAVTA
ncbi:hypothetical protein HQQ80_21520 [Microbacteriaceae bacterium VKM Ac-2855]|nr:hypothetical protein [Microbacteriaceae bacterium VKM Ac-2855]